jgi:hypothetical protein
MRVVLGKGVGVELFTWFWTTASAARWRRAMPALVGTGAGVRHITLGVKQHTAFTRLTVRGTLD